MDFISYPYEWWFRQLKAAALLTLRLQKAAVQHGMSLKDATAYNVAYDEGRPVWIDTLSFERLTPGKPWVAYRQFCQFFLAPLAVMSYVDVGCCSSSVRTWTACRLNSQADCCPRARASAPDPHPRSPAGRRRTASRRPGAASGEAAVVRR